MRTPSVMMSQQHQVRKSSFWLDFFHLYRSMPELWLTNSKEYRNRKLKAASYERLLQHMRQADPTSNIHMLKRKINNLRTSYRRELRKVLESKSLSSRLSVRGANGEVEVEEEELEEEYVPTLWYYNELDFLYEQETGEAQTLLQSPVEQSLRGEQHRSQQRRQQQQQHQLSELAEEHEHEQDSGSIVEMSVQHVATDEANTLKKMHNNNSNRFAMLSISIMNFNEAELLQFYTFKVLRLFCV